MGRWARVTARLAIGVLCMIAGPVSAQVETASTATVAGSSLFSDAPLPSGGLFSGTLDDAPLPSGGLFSGTLDDSPSSLSDAPATDDALAMRPSLTWALRLGATLALDTSFDRKGENVFEVGVYGRLELRADLASGLSAFVAPAFVQVSALDREGGDRAALDLQVPEAYVTVSFERVRLRAGTLLHAWGSTDIVTPSNVLNPVDLRRSLVTAQDGARIPVLGVEATLFLSPLTLRAVVQPFFAASRFYLGGWDTGFAPLVGAQGVVLPDFEGLVGRATADRVGDEVLVIDRPSDRPDHLTLGLRGTVELGDLEVSGTFVWGYEALPRLALDTDLAIVSGAVIDAIADKRQIDLFDPDIAVAFGRLQDKLDHGVSLVQGTYTRRTVAGIDATYALDPVLLELDAAFATSRTLYSQTFAPLTSPALDVVVGVTYTHGEALQLTVEGFALTALDVPAGVRLAVLEPRGLSAPGRRAVVTPGAAAAVRWTVWDGELGFEALVATTFTRHDLVFAPQIRWKPLEHHTLRLGGLLIEGEPDGYGGAYSHNDQLVFGYEWAP